MSRDWNVCVICGVGGGELCCPANSLQKNGIEIYDIFLKLVGEFRYLNALPMNLSFQDGIASQIMLQNRAKWHLIFHL